MSMKHAVKLLFLTLVSSLLSCSEIYDSSLFISDKPSSLSIDRNELDFEYETSMRLTSLPGKITVISENVSWGFGGCPHWLMVMPPNGDTTEVVSFALIPLYMTEWRESFHTDITLGVSAVTVKPGDPSGSQIGWSIPVRINVKQVDTLCDIHPIDFEVGNSGQSLEIELVANKPWALSCPEPWIHPEAEEGEPGHYRKKVIVDMNNTGAKREAEIILETGGIKKNVKIRQEK